MTAQSGSLHAQKKSLATFRTGLSDCSTAFLALHYRVEYFCLIHSHFHWNNITKKYN